MFPLNKLVCEQVIAKEERNVLNDTARNKGGTVVNIFTLKTSNHPLGPDVPENLSASPISRATYPCAWPWPDSY